MYLSPQPLYLGILKLCVFLQRGRTHECIRKWYRKLDDYVQSINFLLIDENHYLYSKNMPHGSPIFFIVYVDHMLLSGNNNG